MRYLRLSLLRLLALLSLLVLGLTACDMDRDRSSPPPPNVNADRSGSLDNNANGGISSEALQRDTRSANELQGAGGRAGTRGTFEVDQITQARANMAPTKGHNVHGVVTFVKAENQPMRILISLSGLEAGEHGFHIHETGDCSAEDASSAGEHFNPENSEHGAPTDSERHLGDLGNLLTQTNGRVDTALEDENMSFSGPHSILGKAVIVHANADDFTTQPSGDAGDPVACGVIEKIAGAGA